MKKQTGIWIDGSKAIIVTLFGGQESIKEIESDIENRIYHEKEGDKGSFMGSRHINNEKKFEERRKHQTYSFLKSVLEQIKHNDELYVFGPAEIKTKLKQHIEKEGNGVVNKLKSVKTADSMSLNQVVAKVKKFYDL
ncbi:MAG: hypothetical protein HYU69_13860 [Bacteroidetes bacterium]|nr:hypothetical protein [Bacteroidota bacterium]